MIRMKTAVLGLVAILALVAVACGDDDSEAIGSQESPSIRGRITTLTPGTTEDSATILVEGEIEADTSFDKASVRIDDDTEVLQKGDDSFEPATVDNLEEGQLVEAWFEGPVAESYPVQAYAARIVILD